MKKFLVIGVNKENLIALGETVKKSIPEIEVFMAPNASEGFETAVAEIPEVILFESVKLNLDGPAICRQLKQDDRTSDIPVIFLVESGEDKDGLTRAVEAGAEAFLRKPIDEAELFAQVSALIKIKATTAERRSETTQSEAAFVRHNHVPVKHQGDPLRPDENLQAENESHRKIEEKLWESEELFRNIFEYHTAIKFIIDPENGNIMDANQSAVRFYGWTKEQLKQMNIRHINVESQEVIDKLLQMARNKQRDHFEFQHRLADGTVRDVEVFSSTIDVKGKQLLHSIVHDINSRKETERAIALSEARLRRAELASKSGNWEFHLDSEIVDASEGARKIYGLHMNQLTFDEIKKIPMPEFRPKLDLAIKHLIEKNLPYDVEFKIKAADTGQIKDIHSIAQFDRTKKIVFGVIQDVSDRKKIDQALQESERQFKQLVEYMQVGVLLQGPAAEILLCNPKSLELLGLEEDQLLGKTSFDPDWNVIHEDGSPFPGAEHPVPRSIALRKPVRNVVMGVYHHRRKDRVWLLVDAEPQLNPDETVRQVVCTFIDITERKNAGEALKENEARLRELNATKDKFFTIIAHDLKSPFNSILGFSNLLLDQIHTNNLDGLEHYASIIESSSQRAMDLLTNLLEWSKSQTGRIEFNPEYIELIQLIEKAVKLSKDFAIQKSIEIRKDLPQTAIAYADKSMISTVLRNLISNAVKFTHTGGQILVQAERLENKWLVTVSDNGVGIKKRELDNLFRIEESHSTVGTNNEKGTGLGLILCKEFIEKHGGRIWAESEPGRGSKFYFTIPVN